MILNPQTWLARTKMRASFVSQKQKAPRKKQSAAQTRPACLFFILLSTGVADITFNSQGHNRLQGTVAYGAQAAVFQSMASDSPMCCTWSYAGKRCLQANELPTCSELSHLPSPLPATTALDVVAKQEICKHLRGEKEILDNWKVGITFDKNAELSQFVEIDGSEFANTAIITLEKALSEKGSPSAKASTGKVETRVTLPGGCLMKPLMAGETILPSSAPTKRIKRS